MFPIWNNNYWKVKLWQTFYLDEPLDLRRRLYIRLTAESDVLSLVHFDFLPGYHVYKCPVRMLRRDHRLRRHRRLLRSHRRLLRDQICASRFFGIDFQTVSEHYVVVFSVNDALVIIGGVVDQRVVDHQRVVRQSNDPVRVWRIRIRFDVQNLLALHPRNRGVLWNRSNDVIYFSVWLSQVEQKIL